MSSPTSHRVGRAKSVTRRCGYPDDAQSVDCDCGEPQAMTHLLSCRLLDEACTADDLHRDRSGKGMRPQVGENCVKDTTEEEETRTKHKCGHIIVSASFRRSRPRNTQQFRTASRSFSTFDCYQYPKYNSPFSFARQTKINQFTV